MNTSRAQRVEICRLDSITASGLNVVAALSGTPRHGAGAGAGREAARGEGVDEIPHINKEIVAQFCPAFTLMHINKEIIAILPAFNLDEQWGI
ncbi:hypothetical protein ACNKHQ_16180 [Shigella flexneri]